MTPQPMIHSAMHPMVFAAEAQAGGRRSVASAQPFRVEHGDVVIADDDLHLVLIPLDKASRCVELRHGNKRSVADLGPEQIVLLPARSNARIIWGGPATGAIVRMNPNALDAFVELEIGVLVDEASSTHARIVGDGDLASLANRMLDAQARDNVGRKAALEAMAKLFVVTLIANHARLVADSSVPVDHLTIKQYRALCAQIDQNLDQSVRVEDLANAAGLSLTSLQRKLMADTGLSPSQFILDRRLRRAAHLIETSIESIGRIAFACGFADQAHLSRAFKARNGMTPSQWRKRTPLN